jgi:hypothetical protein
MQQGRTWLRVGLGLGLLAIAGLGLRAVTDEPTAQASLTMATLGGSTHASSPAEEAIPDGSSAPPALAGSGGRGTGGTSKVPGRRASALPAPDGGGFYEPPSPLPQGKPGDVIWYRPAKATTPLGAQSLASVDAWQVLYLSTDVHGRPDAVTGTILVPKGHDPATMPIIGFAPGTHGIGDSCAPSKWIAAGVEYETIAMNLLLKRGWAVAVTDYQGLGTPGVHTYMIGRPQGSALLDIVRAARRLEVTGLSSTSPVALWGYSQGGSASAWAAQLQPSYAPELPVRAVVAGGTPADLKVVADKLDGSPGFDFLGMSSVALDATYPELKLDNYLTPDGRKAMAAAATNCLVHGLVTGANKRIADYTTTNPLSTPAWQARVNEQKLGRQAPKVPVFLGHGLVDEFIPYSQAVQLKNDWCSLGATVSWHHYLGEHTTTESLMMTGAADFVADRFAGKPAPSSC